MKLPRERALSLVVIAGLLMPPASADETPAGKEKPASAEVTQASASIAKAPNPSSAKVQPASIKSVEPRPVKSFIHPLQKTIEYAKSRSNYIRNHIRDYTCQLVKRERIDGRLQPYQLAAVKFRREREAKDGDDQMPMAVMMEFQAPKSVKGRTVLYVDGENEGLVLVKKGGRGAFKNVELKIDPRGKIARRESNYAITDVGFDKIMDRLVDRVTADIERDPDGSNTKVSYFRGAKVKDRVCTHIQVLHPEDRGGVEFYRASLYVDDELHVPIRLVVYGWPQEDDKKNLPLIEEYNYVNLKLNVGLDDEQFEKQTYFDEIDSASNDES